MTRPARTIPHHPARSKQGQVIGQAAPRGRQDADADAVRHATRLIYAVCCLAGAADLLDEIRVEMDAEGISDAIRRHDTAPLFDWLIAAFSYQGISDRVATEYMARHGRIRWHAIDAEVRENPSCPKLKNYWEFYDCKFDKISRTCAEPDHFEGCPLPRHMLRNGRLNRTAYSLYFFIRDIAQGDLVGWIDSQLRRPDEGTDDNRLVRIGLRVIDPLRYIYGVSDKVLTMTLSCILLAAPSGYEVWREVGGSMIAVDTLVHNFLHRTGILRRFGAEHCYGAACYRDGGCAEILGRVARQIDASAFNPAFPLVFPRFVQHAVWRFCAQNGLGVCNGNRIDDRKPCGNVYCQVRPICDRIVLDD
ncbi:MAG TPA: hypothetical protein VH558_05725 [Pseudolabrys sp.]|jgi:hypothetical protein